MHKKDITIGYACLECKKVFKKNRYVQDRSGRWELVDYEVICPQCASAMYEAGTAFKAPKSTDIKSWASLKSLFESGYKFNPGFGSPFQEKAIEKGAPSKLPESEFRKPARKRSKNA